MKAVSSRLSHLSHSEQQEATNLLALVGLRFYAVHFGNERISLNKLRRLCGNVVKNKSSKRAEANHVEDLRMSRLDAMVHFPFADDSGTIGDILRQEDTIQVSPLLSMGKPGRKRFISKVFNEMRLDQTGIRLYNLPEALERLGIRISSGLRSYLLETRSAYNRDGSLKAYDEQLQAFTKEVLVTLQQFERIACHCLLLPRDYHEDLEEDEVTAETHWLREILFSGNSSSTRGSRGAAGGETDKSDSPYEEYQEECEEDEEEFNNNNSNNHNNGRYSDGEEDSLAGDKDREGSSRRRSRQSSGRATSAASSGRRSSSRGEGAPASGGLTHTAKMKQVPSKIASLVRADRAAHQRSSSSSERAALASLARRRIDLITSMKGPPHAASLAAAAATYPVGPSTRSSSRGSSGRASTTNSSSDALRRDRERLHDPSSGRAAAEIAEAFLSGPLAREMLAPRTVVELRVDEDDSFQYRHRGVREKAAEEQRERQAQALYRPVGGWKESGGRGGGWVADFGPPHTHGDYTGVPSRGEHFRESEGVKPWHHTAAKRDNGKRSSGSYSAAASSDDKKQLEEVIGSIAARSSRAAKEEVADYGLEDSFLVAMSREIEQMKREEEVSFMRDRAALTAATGRGALNYEKKLATTGSSSSTTGLSRRVMEDDFDYHGNNDHDNVDDDDVDSAVVGAGEGGFSDISSAYQQGSSRVDYRAVYGSNFAQEQKRESHAAETGEAGGGTPRSKNLLKVLQSTVSLKEVAAAKQG